jgi:hypothetical protein
MTGGTTRDRRAVVLLVTGGLAAAFYANFLLDWVLRGFTGMGDVVSELEAAGQQNAILLRVTDVVCAVLVLSLLPWVRAGLPRGAWREVVVWGTVVFAVGAAVAAFVPTPCGPDVACEAPSVQVQMAVHDLSSIVSDAGLYVGVAAAWLATRGTGPTWFRRTAWWLFWVGGVVSSFAYQYVSVTEASSGAVGFTQRLHILGICAWIVALSIYAATVGLRARDRVGLTRSRRA